MKIRFITLDGLEQVVDCDQIEGPSISTVMRPCWNKPVIYGPDGVVKPLGFMEYRKYENRYDSTDNIPTVHEVGPEL